MRRALVMLFLLFVVITDSQETLAITVTATPSTANVGDTINITATATFSVTPSCTLEINFGDSAVWYTLGNCNATPCTLSTTHAYTSAGTYTITVRSGTPCFTPPDPPDPANTSVTINALLTVNASLTPSSVRVPQGESSLRNILYQFRASSSTTLTLTSNRGIFKAGSSIIGTNPRSLSVTIQGREGTVSEALLIPAGVLKKALNKGFNSIYYERTFTGGSVTVTTRLSIRITTEAAAEFRIKRLELYFGNGRAEITVPRHFKGLKAYARIRYTGSGLLRGYWEVDGRVLAYVQRHLVYAGWEIIESPEISSFPTFDPGTHLVRFVIEEPEPAFDLPTILYFVTTKEKTRNLTLKLISPENGTSLSFIPPEFRWKGLNQTSLYLIQFFEDPKEQPIFSAYTKSPKYKLPELILRNLFSRGKKYYWRVSGFDAAHNRIAESALWSFSFTEEKRSYVPDEVLVAFKSQRFSETLLQALTKKYELREIKRFILHSLELKVILLRILGGDRDIPELAKQLGKERGVFLAQPNFIFYTLSDPLRVKQILHNLLGLDQIHKLYLGRGILVAVVDTGVDVEHRDLRDRVRVYLNFIRDEEYQSEIHGTAVAGIIAASINGFGIEGVAPAAELLALRACRQISTDNPLGKCFSETLVQALDKAISEKSHIINLSLGTRTYDPLLARVLEEAASRGILMVAPAGRNPQEKLFPASHPAVLAVGGSKAYEANILAPDEKILTTVPGSRYNFLSGASMATAVVSGVLALAEEKYGGELSGEILSVSQKHICLLERTLFQMSLCSSDLAEN